MISSDASLLNRSLLHTLWLLSLQLGSETYSSPIKVKCSTQLSDDGITSLKPQVMHQLHSYSVWPSRSAASGSFQLSLPCEHHMCSRTLYMQPLLSTLHKSFTWLCDVVLTSSQPDLILISHVLSCPHFQQPVSVGAYMRSD
jgi:hypothetical protein